MKKRGQQKMTRQEQKFTALIEKNLKGKSDLRTKGQKTMARHFENISRLVHALIYDRRVGHPSQFDLTTYKQVMNAGKTDGLAKATLESLHGTCRKYADSIGKPHMIPRSSVKVMGSHEFHRHGKAERYNPPQQDTELRLQLQERLEREYPEAAMAAANSLHSGVRKNEALASCEIMRKTMDGKLETTSGCRPGKFREISIVQMRYAFTDRRRDRGFERDYVNRMRPGVEYVVVTDTWAKLGKARLVPILNEPQRQQAIRCQGYVRANRLAARLAGHDKPSRIKSVIEPDKSAKQGYKSLGSALTAVGMTKKLADFTLHSDRTEFNTKMKASELLLSDMERALALGHNDIAKLASYGG